MSAEVQRRLTNYLVNQGYLDTNTRSRKAFANRGEGNPHALADLLQGPFGARLHSRRCSVHNNRTPSESMCVRPH